jgi:hypothetical protein
MQRGPKSASEPRRTLEPADPGLAVGRTTARQAIVGVMVHDRSRFVDGEENGPMVDLAGIPRW